jgi:hypothetical protein
MRASELERERESLFKSMPMTVLSKLVEPFNSRWPMYVPHMALLDTIFVWKLTVTVLYTKA